MFPENYNLPSGRAVKTIMDSSSPDTSLESFSPRDTPDLSLTPENPIVTTVRYVKLNVPRGTEAENEAPGEGGRHVRHAISCEIPPDAETLSLKKSLSSKPRRRSSFRGTSFDSSSSFSKTNRGTAPDPNPNLETKETWKRTNSFTSKKPSEVKQRETSERNEERPFGPKWYPYEKHSDAPREHLADAKDALKRFEKIKFTRATSERALKRDQSGFDSRKDGRRISDITKILQTHTTRTNSESTTSPRDKSKTPKGSIHSPDNEPRGGCTISPLPTAEQLKAAKAVYNGCRTDSESACSGSGRNSGYSDSFLTCSASVVDSWTRKAVANQCSDFDELPSRFAWLKRSVFPLTALAGFILVSITTM